MSEPMDQADRLAALPVQMNRRHFLRNILIGATAVAAAPLLKLLPAPGITPTGPPRLHFTGVLTQADFDEIAGLPPGSIVTISRATAYRLGTLFVPREVIVQIDHVFFNECGGPDGGPIIHIDGELSAPNSTNFAFIGDHIKSARGSQTPHGRKKALRKNRTCHAKTWGGRDAWKARLEQSKEARRG